MHGTKRYGFLRWLFMAAVLAFPLAGQAEVYVEAYLGGVQAGNAGTNFSVPHDIDSPTDFEIAKLNSVGRYKPAVIGGLKIGTWFVKEGFLGYSYPDWMKYFGFYVDFSYHRLDMPKQTISGFIEEDGEFDGFSRGSWSSQGNVATLAFMFPARYGFFPNSEVPFGRLQPYVAVGPALMFSTMRAKFSFTHEDEPFGVSAGSASSTDIALVVDAGFRWMPLKHVSIDLFYKMRLSSPKFSFDYSDPIEGTRASFTYNPGNVLHSGHLGVAYHF